LRHGGILLSLGDSGLPGQTERGKDRSAGIYRGLQCTGSGVGHMQRMPAAFCDPAEAPKYGAAPVAIEIGPASIGNRSPATKSGAPSAMTNVIWVANVASAPTFPRLAPGESTTWNLPPLAAGTMDFAAYAPACAPVGNVR
jgi:hypothetical protein